MSRQRYTAEQVAAALVAYKGMTFTAAKALGCSSATVLNYIKRYPSLAQVLHDVRGAALDLAESQLLAAVERGEGWAVQFFLKTVGKARGYVERQEWGGADGQPVELRVVYEDAPRPDTPADASLHLASPARAGNGHERGGR